MLRAFDALRPAMPTPPVGTWPGAAAAAPATPTWGGDRLAFGPEVQDARLCRELAELQRAVQELGARISQFAKGAIAPAPAPAAAPALPAPVAAPVAPPAAPAGPPAPAPAAPTEAMATVASVGAGPVLSLGAKGDAVARLQDRLRELGVDPGASDGDFGPRTAAAVRDFQARHGLDADGVVGPRTWGALGIVVGGPAPAPPPAPAPAPAANGSGPLLHPGARGPAVVALQDRLRALGHDPGGSDGDFGPATERAVRGFQASRGLEADGVVGPATWRALGIVVEAPPPPPPGAIAAPIANWRSHVSQHSHGGHGGVDIAVPTGTPIHAVKAGEVVYAQFEPGGYGNMAVIKHGDGTFTLYAHQSRLNARVGQRVNAGDVIGAVGSTGQSTGPHLHFEARRGGGSFWSAAKLNPEAYLAGT